MKEDKALSHATDDPVVSGLCMMRGRSTCYAVLLRDVLREAQWGLVSYRKSKGESEGCTAVDGLSVPVLEN